MLCGVITVEEDQVISKYQFAETIEVLRKAIEDNGLKVVSFIDARENLKKIGANIGGNSILEVFHPKFALEVFQHDLRAGIVPPLRIYVYEDGNKTKVVWQSASKLFDPFTGLGDLARRIDRMIQSIMGSIK